MNCFNMGSYPWATALQELLQHRLSWGAVLQDQTAPVWVTPHWSHLPENLLLHRLLSTGLSQLLPGTCSCKSSLWVEAYFRACPPAPAWGSPQAPEDDLLHHGPPQATGGQPASPWAAAWVAGESLSLLNSVIPEALPLLLLGSALALLDMGKASSSFLQKPRCSSPATKALPCKPGTALNGFSEACFFFLRA